MRKSTLAAGILGASLLLAACSSTPHPGPVGNRSVPEPSKPVELQKYMGRWYEQFRYEASFQKDFEAVSADYSLMSNGTVRVVNRGHKGGVNGKLKEAVGKAKISDQTTNAKLKVSFFGPFYGDYWVLDHADDYTWSIVGEPSGRYLWALTRDERPHPELLILLEARVKELGFDWSLVRMTKH